MATTPPSPPEKAIPGVDASLRDLNTIWGRRSMWRRSNLNPERTRAQALLYALSDPLAATRNDPDAQPQKDLRLPHMAALAEVLGDLWASEDGWETQKLIQAVAAAKTTTSLTKMEAPKPE